VDLVTRPARSWLWTMGARFGQNDEELEQLKTELAIAQKSLVRMGQLNEENEALKKQVRIVETKNRSLSMAAIVGEGFGFARISKGAKDNIRPGLPVVVENVMVGKINQVNDYGGSVNLVNSGGFRAAVVVRGAVSGNRRATGLVEGRAGAVRLTRVLREEEISEGDLVVSIDEGFLIGRIEKIVDGGGVYKEADVIPAIDLTRLNEVFIVL
jgi:cell shape-determining protein MreC